MVINKAKNSYYKAKNSYFSLILLLLVLLSSNIYGLSAQKLPEKMLDSEKLLDPGKLLDNVDPAAYLKAYPDFLMGIGYGIIKL